MKNNKWPNFKKKLINKIVKTLEGGKINYTTGPYGKKFEKAFSDFVGNKYSTAICNGTAALEVAIKSLNLPKNSEIIVPARSFFASASCIINTGNIPIFVDVDKTTQNILIEDIARKISLKTKAIICVHLGGLPCDMLSLKKIASKKKIKIIEDCSQAHGASIENQQVGSFGLINIWSFCNDKIISTLGEGGMISTNSKKLHIFCQKYINHGTSLGFKRKSEKFIYNKNTFGTNLRLTEIQSLAGLEQLKDLKNIQKKRESMAFDFYNLICKYDNFFRCFYPEKKIKSGWYRFYFFIKKDIKLYNKIRFEIINELKKNKIVCYTGSCPEIYLEKAFRNLTGFSQPRLNNCKLLGETSIALDVNHTLSLKEHGHNIMKIKKILEKIIN